VLSSNTNHLHRNISQLLRIAYKWVHPAGIPQTLFSGQLRLHHQCNHMDALTVSNTRLLNCNIPPSFRLPIFCKLVPLVGIYWTCVAV
jgi:hypothetical protein